MDTLVDASSTTMVQLDALAIHAKMNDISLFVGKMA